MILRHCHWRFLAVLIDKVAHSVSRIAAVEIAACALSFLGRRPNLLNHLLLLHTRRQSSCSLLQLLTSNCLVSRHLRRLVTLNDLGERSHCVDLLRVMVLITQVFKLSHRHGGHVDA